MLIDWVSMVMTVDPERDRDIVARLAQDRDLTVRLRDGEIAGEWYSRESKRSDSHRLTVGLSPTRITIDGSPARVQADNNVFGSDDLRDCASRMLKAAGRSYGVIFPSLASWRVTRIDLTQNYALANQAEVRAALGELSKVAGGHLKASTFKETVYWNPKSPLWSAKAYDKGEHLRRAIKRGEASASPDQVALASRLLRVEVSLKSRFLRDFRLGFDNLPPEVLVNLFSEVAGKIIPSNAAEIPAETELAAFLVERFGKRKGRNLFAFWCAIKSQGVESVQETFGRSQWHVRVRELRSVGLSLGDLNSGRILAFRPRSIVSRPVDSWEDIRRAA